MSAPNGQAEAKAAKAAAAVAEAKAVWKNESARLVSESKNRPVAKSDEGAPRVEAPSGSSPPPSDPASDGASTDDAPKKVDAAKKLSPSAEAELVRRDRAQRTRETEWKARRDKEDAEYQAKLGKLGDRDALVKLVRDDPAAFADLVRAELKLNDDDLGQIATILHHMAQPEDKRPAKVRELSRGRAQQAQVKSELQQAREKADQVAAELEKFKTDAAAREVQAKVDATWTSFVGQMTASIPEDAPMVRALFEAHPQAVQNDYRAITEELLEEHAEEPDFQITPELLAARYEAHLQKQYGWAARGRGAVDVAPKRNAANPGTKSTSPDGLSSQAKAAPGRPAGPRTEADRVEEAKAAWRAARAAT